MPLNQSSSNTTTEPTRLMNPTTNSNLDIPPHLIPSPHYPQHLPNSKVPNNRVSSTPMDRFYSTQVTTTNINELPVSRIPNWRIFDTVIPSMGETGKLDHGLMDPSSAKGACGDITFSEKEDDVQTLFHNSFDIWGALEDQIREKRRRA